jgi:hypothetical protein
MLKKILFSMVLAILFVNSDEIALAQSELTPNPKAISKIKSAPFGIEVGQSVDRLKISAEVKKNIYIVEPPAPNSQFNSYLVLATKEHGVCKIIASTEKNQNDESGEVAMHIFESISSAIKEKYGKPRLYSTISPASILKNPREWAWSVATGDRIYANAWTNKYGSNAPDDIDNVILKVGAEPTKTTFLELTYEFSNFTACRAAIAKVDSSTL